MQQMRSVEIQARSREEATSLALEQLGATINDVNIDVLAEIKDDFYGDGEVLIRVTLKGAPQQTQQQPPQRDVAPNQSSLRSNRQAAPAPNPQRTRYPDEVIQEYETEAKAIVRELLEMMAVEADVMAVDNPSVMPLGLDEPPTVFIDVTGRDLGMLIGRRGENLHQVQYIVNLLMNREHDEWVRVILDVEGYRIRREESLIGLAERVARQVTRNGRPLSLDPMPPNERRIVHLTLQERSGISTESSGEGSMRRVTVYPQ